MRFNKKALLSTAVAMTLSAAAYADTSTFTFDPTGTAGATGDLSGAATLDWKVGNALSRGGDGLTNGETTQVLYQANLGTVNDSGGTTIFASGAGGNFFTIIASFTEVATIGGLSATFGTDTSNNTAVTSTNFIQICKQSANGDNLAGTGFGCTGSNIILQGYVSGVSSATFAVTSTTPVALDQFGTNNYPTVFTVTGTGATDINAVVTSVNLNYFPDLTSAAKLILSFFNTSNVDPYKQTDPAALFSTNGSTANYGGAGTANIGTLNGGASGGSCPTGFTCGNDFMFQSDSNQSFLKVPEPATISLLGLGLVAAGAAGRMRRTKKLA